MGQHTYALQWNKLYAQQWDKYTFPSLWYCLVAFMVFNANFNNILVISWRSVLLVEESGGPGENHHLVASDWQTLAHNVAHLALIEIRTHNIIGNRYWLHRLVVNPTTIRSQPRLPPITFWFCFTIYVISLHYIILLL